MNESPRIEAPKTKGWQKINVKLLPPKVIYFSLFSGLACLQPVVHLCMVLLGLTTVEIGVMSLVLRVCAFFTRPVIGYLADTYHRHKLIFAVLLIVSALAYNSLALLLKFRDDLLNVPVENVENIISNVTQVSNSTTTLRSDSKEWVMFDKLFWMVVAICFAITISYSKPLLHSITYMVISNDSDEADKLWGNQRLFGSIGACMAVLWSSVVVNAVRSETSSYEPSFYIASLFMGVALVTTYAIKLDNSTTNGIETVTDICKGRRTRDGSETGVDICKDETLKPIDLDNNTKSTQEITIIITDTTLETRTNICEPITSQIDKTECCGEINCDKYKSGQYNVSSQSLIKNNKIKEKNITKPCNIDINQNELAPKQIKTDKTQKRDKKKKSNLKSNIKLFLTRQHALFYAWNFVVGVYNSALGGYVFLHLSYIDGGDSSQTIFGVILSVSLLVEIPMFYLSGRLVERVGERKCLVAVLVCLCVRCLVLSVITESWMAVIVAPLSGVMKAVLNTAANTYAKKLVPEDMVATALGAMSGVRYGLGSGMGDLLTGVLFYTVGTRWSYRIYTIIALVFSVVYTIIQTLVERKTDSYGLSQEKTDMACGVFQQKPQT